MKKDSKNSYLYIGIHYDLYNDREIGIKDKKVGETVTPQVREHQLSKTKSPIGYMYVKLYEFLGGDTAQTIEKNIIHPLLATRNTLGEWFKDEEERLVSDVEQALKGLTKLGISYTEVPLSTEDTPISENKKKAIKNNAGRNYWDVNDVEKATDDEDQYSLWELKNPQGKTYYSIYNISTTRANGKKACEKTAMNYCNSEGFLKLVDFDYTKLTAKFIMSSNDKKDIDNKVKELKK